LGARAHSIEPIEKSIVYPINAILLLIISLILPPSGMTMVCTSWYEVNIHPASTSEVSKSEIMTGKATATEEPLIDDNSSARLTTEKTRYLRIMVYLSM